MNTEKTLKILFGILSAICGVLFLVGVTWPGFMAIGAFIGYSFHKAVLEHSENNLEVTADVATQIKNKPVKKRNADSPGTSELKNKLSEAMRAGEVIRIKYWGGSTPGESREIFPIRFDKNGLLMARCIRENSVKTFNVEKIEIENLEDAA